MIRKCVVILLLWVGSYALVLYLACSHHWWMVVIATMALAGSTLLAQMGVMHDASHGSLSKNNNVNRLMDLTLIMAGATPILWNHKHVRAHHRYTNIPGKDHDIEGGSFLRFHTGEKWYPWHRFQHLYALLLYSMLVIKWIWIDDLYDAVRNTYGIKGKNYIRMWLEVCFARVVHIGFHIALPYFIIGSAPMVIGLYLLHWVLVGISLSVIFQLAHITDVQSFPSERLNNNDWATHQLSTTADFAVSNRFLTWAIGGLNHQVEHHIFPRISHVHYPSIQPIIRKICAERNVKYHEYKTVWDAIKAHFRQLREMGKK